MSFNITPVASGYQEIHPYSAMNIDSVKINTSLIMMKEWKIHPIQWISQYLPRFGGARLQSAFHFKNLPIQDFLKVSGSP